MDYAYGQTGGGGGVPTSRTVNGHPLSSDVVVTSSDVSAVPTTRTVAGHALSSNVTITAADVGADAAGAAAAVTPASIGAVPTSCTVNGKALTSNVTLSAADVGADAAGAAAAITLSGLGGIPATQKAAANGVATLDAGVLVPATQLPLATAVSQGATSGNAMAAMLATMGLVPVTIVSHTCGAGETSLVVPMIGSQWQRFRVEVNFPGAGLNSSIGNPYVLGDAVNGRCKAIYTSSAADAAMAFSTNAYLGIWSWSGKTIEANFRSTGLSNREWAYESHGDNIAVGGVGETVILQGYLPQFNTSITVARDGTAALPTGTTITVTGVLVPS